MRRSSGSTPPELEYELFIDGRRYIADAAWPEQRVALEFDGRDPHMRRWVHDYDTGRRNDFTDAGWLRFGITATALKQRDDRAFRQVARAIARRKPLVACICDDMRYKSQTRGGARGRGSGEGRGQPSRAMGISAMTPSRMR